MNARWKIVYSFKSSHGEKQGGWLERCPEKEVDGTSVFCLLSIYQVCISLGYHCPLVQKGRRGHGRRFHLLAPIFSGKWEMRSLLEDGM